MAASEYVVDLYDIIPFPHSGITNSFHDVWNKVFTVSQAYHKVSELI